jgi:hypothetical protein
MRIRRSLSAVFALQVLMTAHASAQFTTFTSRASFESVSGHLTTEQFSVPLVSVPTSGASYGFAGGTVTFDLNHGFETFGGGDLYADLHPSGSGAPQFLRIDFAQPVTAFGADFSEFDFGVPPIQLHAWIGASSFQFGEGFFGVVGTIPFTRVEIRDPSDFTFFAMDDLSSSAVGAPVPEPATLRLVGSALTLGAFARLRWRRRKYS